MAGARLGLGVPAKPLTLSVPVSLLWDGTLTSTCQALGDPAQN